MKTPFVWFEVVGKNGTQLRRFYSDLFGWKIEGATGEMDCGLVAAADGGIGGGIGTSQDGDRGHVTFAYFVDPEGHVVGLSKGAV
jgi:predicted enzyme related to lactoylglutathione lyase